MNFTGKSSVDQVDTKINLCSLLWQILHTNERLRAQQQIFEGEVIRSRFNHQTPYGPQTKWNMLHENLVWMASVAARVRVWKWSQTLDVSSVWGFRVNSGVQKQYLFFFGHTIPPCFFLCHTNLNNGEQTFNESGTLRSTLCKCNEGCIRFCRIICR